MPRRKRPAEVSTAVQPESTDSTIATGAAADAAAPAQPAVPEDVRGGQDAAAQPPAGPSTELADEKRPFALVQDRFTSSAAGVKAGFNFRYNAQPFVQFPDDRPPTADERKLLDGQGENDPRFRYRGNGEKTWTGPSTPESRDKAISVARRIKDERLKQQHNEKGR